MALTRQQIQTIMVNYFSDHFHLPPDNFPDSTKLRDDLLFDDNSLVALGKWINMSHALNVSVKPPEMVACKTIGDIIDLILKKQT